MRDELEGLRRIAPDAERMLAVRRRVLAQITAESQPNWSLRLAWVFGLALMIAGALWVWPEQQRLDLAGLTLPDPVRPPEFAYDFAPRRPIELPPPPPAPRIEWVGLNQPEGETKPAGDLLRLRSNDPDVILFYLLEEPGDSL